jgi:hypothetical protein
MVTYFSGVTMISVHRISDDVAEHHANGGQA